MKPNPVKREYEKVRIGDFILGTIHEVKREEKRETGFKNEDGTPKIQDSVRFQFKLDGYKYFHYSRWMSFSYGEKSNLYSKYLVKLVKGAEPDMDFDLEALRGLRVKTIWAEKNDFQYVESIFPEKEQILVNALPVIKLDEEAPADGTFGSEHHSEEPPF